MSFEKSWLLHKMNMHAPAGYRFIAVGKDGRIAMFAPEFMDRDNVSGPFVSHISFDLLNTLYGNLLTMRSDKIFQGAPIADYVYDFNVAKPDVISSCTESRHASYVSVIRTHNNYPYRPLVPFIRKNAILAQGLLDSKAAIPEYLHKRMGKYVNDCVWYAVMRVFESMPICDMRYYQDEYRKKMQELGIVPGQEFGLFPAIRESNARQIMDMECKIDDLKFDVLPRQKQELKNLTSNKPDDTDSHDKAQARICDTYDQIEQLSRSRDALEPKPKHQPARDMLYNEFHDEAGNLIIPKLGNSAPVQFIKLALMREEKSK